MTRDLRTLLATLGLFSMASSVMAVTKAVNPATQNSEAPQQNGIGQVYRTPSAVEIVKLKQAGVDASVIKAYIESARAPYAATMEDILYLHEHKVPDELVVAWMRKGTELINLSVQARNAAVARQNAQPAPAQPQVIYQTPPQTAPVYQTEPVYQSVPVAYTSPYYYYYGSPYYVSAGWGWPYYWGWYGHRYGWYGHGYHHGGHYPRHYANYGHYGGRYGHGGYGHHGGYNGYRGGGYANHGGYRYGNRSGGNSFAGGSRYMGGGARPQMASGGFRGGGGGGGGGFRGGGRR